MRNLELLVTALLVALFVLPASLADASVAPPTASAVPSAKLSVSVGVDPGGNVRFAPATILIPQVNLTLNVTFYNNYTTPGMKHTFTIFNADMPRIGIIGIAATLAWTGISYFVIKSSSRHQKGHREHIRKGLP